jgi:hypothetical protein
MKFVSILGSSSGMEAVSFPASMSINSHAIARAFFTRVCIPLHPRGLAPVHAERERPYCEGGVTVCARLESC